MNKINITIKAMRNSIKFGALALLTLFGTISCEDSNNVIDQVLDTTAQGAVLRTISVNAGTLNADFPDLEFSVTVEEQDNQEGGLMQQVNLYANIDDKTPANGETVLTERALVKTIMPSDFEPGPFGLPRATITSSLTEAANAMGISVGTGYIAGDLIVLDLELVLTDGRAFDFQDAGTSVTGGFYASPFRYVAPLVCAPEPGDYTVNMVDSYGDGWQTTTSGGGDAVTVDIDGTIVEFGMCSPYGSASGTFLESGAGTGCTENDGSSGVAIITIPPGTVSAEWNFPGDNWGEIGMEVIAPDGTTVVYQADPGTISTGIIPVVFCLME